MASRYWIGTWNWDASTTTNWSASSWWAGWASVPTTSDNVFFDASSTSCTVTASAVCIALNFTWFTWTFAGSQWVTVTWDVTLSATMTFSYTWNLSFWWSWTKVFTSNWKTIACPFVPALWTVQLWDDMITARWWWWTINAMQITWWSFNANWKTVTFKGNQFRVSWAFTFYNVIIAPTTPASTDVMNFDSNVTISWTFTDSVHTSTNFLTIWSSVAWTRRIISMATFAGNNIRFKDIAVTGAASPISATALSDGGNNTWITFSYSRYWVGGSGNVTDGTHWAATSWGTGNQIPPWFLDNAICDSASNATGYTLTMNATISCADLTLWNPATWVITIAGNVTHNIYWSLSIASWAVVSSWFGTTVLKATSGTKTVTTNWVVLNQNWTLDWIGGTFQLADNFSIASTSWKTLTYTNWTFDPNWKRVTIDSPGILISGAFSFYDLTLQSTLAPSPADDLSFTANQTINWTLTINGNSALNRMYAHSNTKGTARTLTAATVSVTNADFQDITGAGAWSWNLSAISGNSWDCWWNSWITFTSPATVYLKTAVSVNLNASNWYTTSWGSTLSRVPLPQDTAIIDANSVTTSGKVLTLNNQRIWTLDFTWVVNSPTFTSATWTSFFWSLRLSTWVWSFQWTTAWIFEWRWSFTIKSGWKVWGKNITINCISWSYQLEDTYDNWGNNDITHTSWGFDVNSQALSIRTFTSSNTNVRTLTCGTGNTISIKWNWDLTTATNLTFNKGTATISMVNNGASCTFNGWGVTYNNFFNSTWGASICTMSGNNTFNDFKVWWARTHKFSSWSVTTISSLTSLWSAGNLVTLTSASWTHTLKKLWGWVISADFLSISTSIAVPINTFYAGANSTNWGTNTNWNFTVPRTPNTAFAGFF